MILCTKTNTKHILFREIHKNMRSIDDTHSWALTGYSNHTERTQTDTGTNTSGILVLTTANMFHGDAVTLTVPIMLGRKHISANTRIWRICVYAICQCKPQAW